MLIEQVSDYNTQFKKGKLQHNTIDYMTRRISGTSTDQKVSMAHLIKFPAGTSKETLIKKYPSWTSLSKLGFSFDTCIVALKLHDGDMKLASKWLLSLGEDDIDKWIEFETRNIIQDKKYKRRETRQLAQEQQNQEEQENSGTEKVAESLEKEKDSSQSKNRENDVKYSKWICKRRRAKNTNESIQQDARSKLSGEDNALEKEEKADDPQYAQKPAELHEGSKDEGIETSEKTGDPMEQNKSQGPQEIQNAQKEAEKNQNEEEEGMDADTFNVKNRTSYEALFYKPLWKIVERLVTYKIEHSNFELEM